MRTLESNCFLTDNLNYLNWPLNRAYSYFEASKHSYHSKQEKSLQKSITKQVPLTSPAIMVTQTFN